jgi:hypothetical protein
VNSEYLWEREEDPQMEKCLIFMGGNVPMVGITRILISTLYNWMEKECIKCSKSFSKFLKW